MNPERWLRNACMLNLASACVQLLVAHALGGLYVYALVPLSVVNAVMAYVCWRRYLARARHVTAACPVQDKGDSPPCGTDDTTRSA